MGTRPARMPIASAAGVTCSTLYAHFPSRRVLLESTSCRTMQLLDRGIANLDSALPACEAVDRLVATSLSVLGRLPSIVSAAQDEVRPAQFDQMSHESVAGIRNLLERGRAERVFRTDQDVRWQAQCVLAVAQVGVSRVGSGCTKTTVLSEMTSTLLAILAAGREGSA